MGVRSLPRAARYAALFGVALCCTACGDDAVPLIDVGVDVDAPDSRGAPEGQCEEWGRERGDEPCADRLRTEADLDRLGIRRALKFVAPHSPAAGLRGPVFLNSELYDTHLCFLSAFFPELVGGAFPCGFHETYDPSLVDPLFHEPDRLYTVGYVEEYEPGRYGFGVRLSHALDLREDMIELHAALQSRFDLGRLELRTSSDAFTEEASMWDDVPFEVVPSDEGYIAYSHGRGCGYVRLLDPGELEEAIENGILSFRDFVVLETAPVDLAPVVSGIVTATRQGALSHLSVRSAARGTPNAFSTYALERFEEWRDELVCVEVDEDAMRIEAATDQEAAEFWTSVRPSPLSIVAPNTIDTRIVSLSALPTESAEERRAALARYGAKGTNLSTLYRLAEDYDSYRGVLLPAAYYARFLDESEWTVDLGDGERLASFRETLDAWNADASLFAQPARLRTQLLALQEAMEVAEIPDGIVQDVHAAIVAEYGNDTTEVRFRSSSNAEDALGFSGAGLYDSTSVCAADSVDDDERGASRCGTRDEERTIERGLRRVWASVWNLRAVLERDWYGIDASDVSMSILVNDRSENEQANAVAFSGNPIDGSGDLLVTAQVGDVELVRPEPGVRPETLRLVREGRRIVRVQRVTLSTEGSGIILSEAQALAIGEFLIDMQARFPIDDEVPDGRQLMLDTEWKVLAGGTLVVKQVRPFLR